MKCDKVNEDNLVNVLLGQNYATMMQMPFYTCSYPSGRNIADSVIAMAELIYDELDFYDPVKPFVNKRELVILGDSNTGKTSLLDWFSNKDFKEKFVPTVLANKTEFDATIGKETIKVQITEIAGSGGYEERMMQIIKNKCDGLILMYDCTNNDSFNNVTSWLNLFKKTVNKDVPMVLVANKKDLVKNDEYCEGNIFAEQNNMDYVEISVKHRDNLESIIMNLI
jgi:Ras-related protein Rab-1A